MSIHDNLIYKEFIDFLDRHEKLFKIHFSWEKEKYLKFYSESGELIEKIDIDLQHNEFLIQAQRFKDWYRRMKASEMDDK